MVTATRQFEFLQPGQSSTLGTNVGSPGSTSNQQSSNTYNPSTKAPGLSNFSVPSLNPSGVQSGIQGSRPENLRSGLNQDHSVSKDFYAQKFREFGINDVTITSGTGTRGWNGGKLHGGIDASGTGQSHSPFEEAVVVETGDPSQNNSGFGGFVRVAEVKNGQRTGLEMQVSHLSALSVQKGQTIQYGDKLGEEGSTGFSTGPHDDIKYFLADGIDANEYAGYPTDSERYGMNVVVGSAEQYAAVVTGDDRFRPSNVEQQMGSFTA